MTQSVLTIASGKAVYIEMAINLARSFFHWHREGDIGFYLATDHPEMIPADLLSQKGFYTLPFVPGQYGESFSTKLHLDDMAKTDCTLFIDADCLICGSLQNLFARLKGQAVAVVGRPKSEGEWFGDVASFCKKFEVPSIPGFNGCFYYLEKGAVSTSVYSKARELEPQYVDMGMKLLRGRPNDELLMSVSLAIHGLQGIYDDGTIYGDPLASPGKMEVDVLTGKTRLCNPLPPHPLHREWYPFHITSPVIVHFLGNFTELPPYTAEVLILKRVKLDKWPEWMARAEAYIKITFPWQIITQTKNLLRPVYHALWGYRKVKVSKRI